MLLTKMVNKIKLFHKDSNVSLKIALLAFVQKQCLSNEPLKASHISMVFDALFPAPYTLRIIVLIFRGENVNKVGSLSYHTTEKWPRFCPSYMAAMTAHWVNWCQFSQILNVLLCLINRQAFLELDVLKGMNLQLWDATTALNLHEK